MGFTITELLMAAAMGIITATVAGQALVSHLESSERAEALERQRNDWARSTQFIESEIALSEHLFKDIESIVIPGECAISTTSSSSEFRLAIDMRRDLPLVIYAVKPSQSNWLPENTLWRCGPDLNADGSYNSNISMAPLLDGLDGNAPDGGFTISSNTTTKHTDFTLALKGHATVKYGMVTGARARISPLYTKPTERSLCDASNMVKKKGTAGADQIDASGISVIAGEDILICGYGGGDTLSGSDANDIIEAGDTGPSTLNGGKGNDVLRGTHDADTINGGDNNDILIGRGGNDDLDGGAGQNIYLPGDGDDIISGGSGLDIVFFNSKRSDYEINECHKISCTVKHSTEGDKSLKNVEILIFNDARLDLSDPPEAQRP